VRGALDSADMWLYELYYLRSRYCPMVIRSLAKLPPCQIVNRIVSCSVPIELIRSADHSKNAR